ncbi:hypothetical protein GCM10027598_33380 [Amycolatopsis oliviviridis]|uniref:DUF4034 domain-containing protein n=1 Tax=Amycolatopsis oliviviridis TaxID=1471590 RepID=A0ABQ3LR48_9PSEU|nr:DUF4034 domain-containing protein [Amycolatopsis oliviviridis]GHH23596.1 hypothetical protein GCM10017790_46780 [Amycolatopsis oliviviridis]
MLWLLKSRERKAVFAMMKEAKRRGVEIDELKNVMTPEEFVALLPPEKPKFKGKVPDVTRWGLPPDNEVSTKQYWTDEEVLAVQESTARGEWTGAAALLASTWGDWDRRNLVTGALGEAAATDDGWLRAWREARPGDPGAALVNAESLVHVAWEVRSGLQAKHVTEEQFAAFFRVLAQAEEAVHEASELAPADPTPWVTALAIAMGQQAENDQYLEVWAELTERDPQHRGAHTRALQYWCAKWFGSNEKMWEFAETAAAKSPKLAPLLLIAAHESEFQDVSAWRDPRVAGALDGIVAWLDGEGRDHPSTRSDRAYAAKALVENGRFDEAVEQFRHLGTRADAGIWAYSGDARGEFLATRYAACFGATKP